MLARHRLVALSDIEEDLDDTQSFVRLFLPDRELLPPTPAPPPYGRR